MDQNITIGIIGAGWCAKVRAATLVAAGENTIVWVAAPERTASHAFAKTCGEDTVAHDVESLADSAFAGDDKVDLVVVATPASTSADHAIQALEAGCDVLLEGPGALTLADFDRLVDVETSSGRTVHWGNNLLHAAVVEDAIQPLRTIRSPHHASIHYDLPEMERNGGEDDHGPLVFELGVHAVGLALLLAAPSAPTTIRGVLDDPEKPKMVLGFASGLQTTIELGRDRQPRAQFQVASLSDVLAAELAPTQSLERNGSDLSRGTEDRDDHLASADRLGWVAQTADILDCIANARRPRASVALARGCADIVMGAIASHRADGVPLDLPAELDRTEVLGGS